MRYIDDFKAAELPEIRLICETVKKAEAFLTVVF